MSIEETIISDNSKAIELFKTGISLNEIARLTNLSYYKVQKIVTGYLNENININTIPKHIMYLGERYDINTTGIIKNKYRIVSYNKIKVLYEKQ